MLFLKLAWRNLWRNKRRSVIELTSIAGSVFLAVTYNNLVKGSYAQMIESGVRTQSGHVGFYHPEYLESRRTEYAFDPQPIRRQLETNEHVEKMFERLYAPGLARSGRGSRPAVLMGLDIASEQADSPLLQPRLLTDGDWPSQQPSRYTPVVIGQKMAEELGLKVRRKFVFMTQSRQGDMQSRLMRVTGIVRTGVSELDGNTIIADRTSVATALGLTGSVHELAVMLPSQDEIEDVYPVASRIADQSPGVQAYTWKEAMPGLANAVRMDYAGIKIIVGFIYFLVAIGTINTLLMSVMERVREFGVIRSLGLSAAGVRRMVLVEAFVLGVTGSVIGLVGAMLLNIRLVNKGIDIGKFGEMDFEGIIIEPIIYSTWDVGGMLTFAGLMIGIAVVAAIYPAYRALQVKPADAMRHY